MTTKYIYTHLIPPPLTTRKVAGKKTELKRLTPIAICKDAKRSFPHCLEIHHIPLSSDIWYIFISASYSPYCIHMYHFKLKIPFLTGDTGTPYSHTHHTDRTSELAIIAKFPQLLELLFSFIFFKMLLKYLIACK